MNATATLDATDATTHAAVPGTVDSRFELTSQDEHSLNLCSRLPSGPLSSAGTLGQMISEGQELCLILLPLPNERVTTKVGQQILTALLKSFGQSSADKERLAKIFLMHQLNAEDSATFFGKRPFQRMQSQQYSDPSGRIADVMRAPRIQVESRAFVPKPVALFFEDGAVWTHLGYEATPDPKKAAPTFVDELLELMAGN